jgi:osmotically-inducible protein OsmY
MTRPRRLSTILTTVLFAALAACASTSKQEGMGEYVDDTVITGRVKAALVADPALKATEINVETFKGTVQLSGFVAEPDHIGKAVALAHGIKGVKVVRNDILIKK